MMETVLGCQFDKFPLNLTYIVDLSYFDGSLMSVFKSEHGDFYIYNWCDVDDQFNRWLVFRVKRKSLIKYLERELSLRDLVLSPIDGFQYLLDIDDHLNVKNAYVVQPDNLPESYIPGKNSYYNDLQLNPESLEEDKKIIKQEIYSEGEEEIKLVISQVLENYPSSKRISKRKSNFEVYGLYPSDLMLYSSDLKLPTYQKPEQSLYCSK